MFRLRSLGSILFSLAWKVSIPVIGAGVLIGIFLKESDDLRKGAQLPANERAVFSDQGTKVVVTLRDAVKGNFSSCVIQDQRGMEIARLETDRSGYLGFAFGSNSIVRGSGGFRKNGAVSLGVLSDVNHKYFVTIQADGSSVVETIVRRDDHSDEIVRTVRLSPSGEVLSEQSRP